MLQADRAEFDRQVSLLCAAYNVPIINRADALWLAFNKLRLDDWMRIISHAIGPDGPEKFPTVRQLWGTRKALQHTPHAARSGRDPYLALTEAALGRFHGQLSEWQRHNPGCHWSYIVRDPTGPNCELLGLIIERDPHDPLTYPERRLLVSEYRHDEDEAA